MQIMHYFFKGLEPVDTWLERAAYRMMDAQVCLPSEAYKAPSGPPTLLHQLFKDRRNSRFFAVGGCQHPLWVNEDPTTQQVTRGVEGSLERVGVLQTGASMYHLILLLRPG